MEMRLPMSTPYTLIVLCGGQGSRLGGADKGLLRIDGQQFAQRLINRIAGPIDSSNRRPAVLISANRHREQYEALGYPVIPDLRSGFQGPLAGIEACLQCVTDGPVVIVPADMPDLPADLACRLLAPLTLQSIVIAHDGEQLQPLCMAMYPQQWHESLTTWLDHGGRGVHRWLSDKPVLQAHFLDASEFSNINEKSDLRRVNGQIVQIDAQSTLIGYDRRHDHYSCQ